MPDDPLITEMDPVQKIWMFYSWIEDRKEHAENYKNHAYLIGGFSNPQMLQKIIGNEQNAINVSEEDFEQSLEIVKQSRKNMEKEASLKRRKRRKKIGN